MSTMTGTQGGRTETMDLGGRNKAGLVVCGLLGLADVVGLAFLSAATEAEVGPPAPVIIFAAVMGVVTLAAVVHTWRTRARVGARLVAGSRVLSALTSVPAFFVDNVSPGLVAGAGGGIVVALVGIWLLLSRTSRD